MAYIFNAETETPESIKRKRAIADALIMSKLRHAPRDVGEGINSIGQALAARILMDRADAKESAAQKEISKLLMGSGVGAAPVQPTPTPPISGSATSMFSPFPMAGKPFGNIGETYPNAGDIFSPSPYFPQAPAQASEAIATPPANLATFNERFIGEQTPPAATFDERFIGEPPPAATFDERFAGEPGKGIQTVEPSLQPDPSIAKAMSFSEAFTPKPQAPQRVASLGGVPQSGGIDPRYSGAIAKIESGGRYDLLGPVTRNGDRAHGKYQVMGNNVGPWTQEVLGRAMTPQEFLASPEAQEAVFQAKFGGYVRKHGPEGAARAWFAGEGGMNDPNRKDILGT
jgi:hypothetical protein